ncbi:MAG: restriction endonuclease [Actinomycetia bacterium]|nr:restriction endonuclease [Actinomycetes bacterium]
MTHAWVIRSGRHGERDSWALQSGFSGGGWNGVPDLTPCNTREDIANVVATTFKGEPDGKIANFAGQLWALRGRIKPGDLMAMPLKTTKQIALGRVTGPYEYRSGEADPTKRHVVPVDWQRVDLPRASVKQDLLFTLGSAMSIFSPSKNLAVTRLEHLLEHGTDPGQVAAPIPVKGNAGESTGATEGVDEPELQTNIEEVATDRITSKIAEEFAGHGLATLVTALLTAAGLQCRQSPPGPDGGIDIIAGRGVLGLDDPILVQVKSGGQVGAPVVSQLHGVMSTHGATQGLLVAWGGLTKPAQDALKSSQLRVRVWQATDVVDAVLTQYDRLDDDTRSRLPLKRVWMLADSED